ncbi:MAG: hypothetical protein R3D63_06200 [Paracoccaceae bacterium]
MIRSPSPDCRLRGDLITDRQKIAESTQGRGASLPGANNVSQTAQIAGTRPETAVADGIVNGQSRQFPEFFIQKGRFGRKGKMI